MIAQFVAIAAFITAASGQTGQLGIASLPCPNYPYCAEPAARAIAFPAQGYSAARALTPLPTPYLGTGAPIISPYGPQFQYRNPASDLAALPPGVPPAATHPAGVDPRLCPDYPLCDNAILHAFL